MIRRAVPGPAAPAYADPRATAPRSQPWPRPRVRPSTRDVAADARRDSSFDTLAAPVAVKRSTARIGARHGVALDGATVLTTCIAASNGVSHVIVAAIMP